MAWVVPRQSVWTLRKGDQGIVVWALQRQCQRIVKEPRIADGEFGRGTETAVILLQRKLDVEDDGIAGPATQRALGRWLANRADGIPRNMILSLMFYESGCLLGAVNWRSTGGVDCGMCQRRVLDQSLDNEDTVERAFDAAFQISLAATTFKDRFESWIHSPGIAGRRERCWRTAVLYHNYPALADRLTRGWIHGLPTYYKTPQPWVMSVGLRFPDGTPIRTPLEWGQRYSLGTQLHDEPGQAVKLVRDWSA